MRLLHIEDDAHDAELVRALLRREWPDCTVTLVATRDELVAELAPGRHDLILSDYSLVSFDGLTALTLARAQAPDTPFIFFTGTLGEARAIASMHEGAADYVLKDQPERLVPALRRALREAGERRSRHRAEEQLRQSEERYRLIFAGSPMPTWIYDVNTLAVLDVNDAALAFHGYTRAEFLARSALDLRPPAEARRFLDHLRGDLPPSGYCGVWPHQKKDGTLVDVEIFSHEFNAGAAPARLVQANDLTARRAAERRIRDLVDLLNRAPEAIIVSELDGRVTFWNHGAERLSGWKAADAFGRELAELFGAEAAPKIADARAVLDQRGEWRSEVLVRDRHGNPLDVEINATLIRGDDGRPRARLCIANDVTERKKLEERFLRAQRLESIGMLAAGIAHDLNNVLAPILMGAPMLREHIKDPGDLQLVGMFEKSAERGAGLVRQILGFAHGVGGDPTTIQPRHLLRDIATFVNETFPKNIKFEERAPRDLWPISANATQIHQVLLNLCVNARDAMPAGGVLRLRAENLVLDEIAARHLDGARAGAWIVLSIEDTGVGIPAATLARIWEPFYTTKDTNKGTGLGLSTVRGIVETHQGFVAVQSEPGRGTVFRVYLPAATATLGETAVLPVTAVPRGNGELVLIVDDEPNIRNVATVALSRHGYRVLAARDGTDALALFAPRCQDVSLVITDLNMPRLDGATIANVVRRLSPGVKILVASGLSSADSAPDVTPAYADAFLPKPFTAEALLVAVHRLLTAPPAVATKEPAPQ